MLIRYYHVEIIKYKIATRENEQDIILHILMDRYKLFDNLSEMRMCVININKHTNIIFLYL